MEKLFVILFPVILFIYYVSQAKEREHKSIEEMSVFQLIIFAMISMNPYIAYCSIESILGKKFVDNVHILFAINLLGFLAQMGWYISIFGVSK